MNLNEWHEQAGRAAYEAIASDLEPHPDLWDDTSEATRERWRGVARAVIAEGKIEVRPSAELAEAATREENKRLAEIATNAVDDVGAAREVVAELRKQVRRYERWADEHVQKFERKHAALVTAQQQLDKVRKIVFDDAALSTVPDVNEMNRGFGNCPHCRSPRVTRCHECLNEIFRDEAHAAGWRMDHLGGFGCIALCPDHK